MIDNDSLFDHFRVARRHRRSGWGHVRNVSALYSVIPAEVVPAETVGETDVLDDGRYDNCGECGDYDYAAMFTDGLCGHCLRDEWRETLASVAREEYALMV